MNSYVLFNKKLKMPLTRINEEYHIENKPALILGLVHLLGCLTFLIISSYIGIEMWLVSLISASSLLICTFILCLIKKKDWSYLSESFKKLPYPLIPFF